MRIEVNRTGAALVAGPRVMRYNAARAKLDKGEGVTGKESEGEPQPREVLSEAEERFEYWRKRVGLFLGPLAALILILMPFPGLTPEAHRLAAILGFVVVFWITEPIPIPITALLGPALCVLAGVAAPKAAFAPFGNPIIFLFIGSFFIARAMQVHRLDRRFALSLLSLPAVGDSPARILFVFGAIAAFLSMWLSNTASTAMMFPIALGILGALRGIPAERMPLYSTGFMLMVAYAASVGGIGTVIGTPPNLIGVGLIEQNLGLKISFFDWMRLGVPILALMFVVLYFLILRLHPPGIGRIEGIGDVVRARRAEMGPWTAGQINAGIAFMTAVFLWTFPGMLTLVLGADHSLAVWFDDHLPEGVAALLAAGLLFVLPVDLRRGDLTLGWRDAARIDWGTILLFGGGLALGAQMFQTGLSEAIGEGFVELFEVHTLWGITAMAILVGIFTSELTSNTASATMVVPVMMAIAASAGVSPIPPALGACLGASFGFMLPVSTPPNAIVYGSGLVPITRMVRAGLLFDLLGFVLIWVALRILCPLLGFM